MKKSYETNTVAVTFPVLDKLSLAESSIRGLLYLLSENAAAEERDFCPASKEESEGIRCLTLQVGEHLSAIVKEVCTPPLVIRPITPKRKGAKS